jgi:dTDP-4-dehydrorhamnose reductase
LKVLLAGGAGLLGARLNRDFMANGIAVDAPPSTDLDLTSTDAIRLHLNQRSYDWVVNCVGQTSVDECELNPTLANLLNAETVANLRDALEGTKTRLLHVSTDHLYDSPTYALESEVQCLNQYAKSKFAGEQALANTNHVILRTNFVGKSISPKRESLTDWLINQVQMKVGGIVLDDVFFSPLPISTLSDLIQQVMSSDIPPGIYNAGSTERVSKADFDFAFLEAVNLPSHHFKIGQLRQLDFLKAVRPQGMAMNSSKLESTLGITLPSFEEVIRETAKDYE